MHPEVVHGPQPGGGRIEELLTFVHCVCMYVVCAYAYTDTSECLHTVHHARLIDRGRESKEKFHSVVVEAQTYLAKLIIAYIRRYCNTCTSVG